MGVRGHRTAPIRLCLVLVLDATRGIFLLAWFRGRIVSPVCLIDEQQPYIRVHPREDLAHIGRRRGGIVHEAGKWAQGLEVTLGYAFQVVAIDTRFAADEEQDPRNARVSA